MNGTWIKDKLNKLAKFTRLFSTAVIILFIVSLVLIAVGIIWRNILRPVSPKVHLTEVVVHQGLEAEGIARLLEDNKLIRDSRVFLLLAKFRRASRNLKAGEYRLSPHMNYFEILDRLENGRVVLRKFTVPEGMTIEEIATLWEKQNFGRKDKFIQAASRTELLKRLGMNPEHLGISNLEGYLFPETYKFVEGTGANTVVNLMFREFCKRFEDLRGKNQENKMSIHEIVTLASIIESEANLDEERPIISAVCHNRLKQNRKLEVSPTVFYVLENPRKRLTYEDIKIDSPYNTYKYKGLPPGPVCNPGLASILAAINPAKTDYMYFVAKGDGTHYFSKTFKAHKKAIAKIRH